MVFGSIADRVIRHGETPTLIVRVGELTRNPKMPRRVIVALDGSELAEKARTKKLLPDDVQGGTFTITNPGGYGTFHGTPIISQPQVATDSIVRKG